MTKRSVLLIAGLVTALVMSYVLATAADLDNTATKIEATQVQREAGSENLIACTMVKNSGIGASFYDMYEVTTGAVTYFDPAVECGAPAYPFEITQFSFTLHDPGGYVWPAVVDVVVYDLAASGNPCDGPGVELCRFTVTANQAVFQFPAVGTVGFPTPCCVNRPFFIGLVYATGAPGSTPSIVFDDNPAPDTCDNWQILPGGVFAEWYDFWAPPVPGYPLYWVDGETQSANCDQPCDWNPGDAHKMHFPQLPDEAGWDVNGSESLVLGDDWRCTETGYVKDIHWWGSWKDGLEGGIQGFLVEIHDDVPDPDPTDPTTYSMPGPVLWSKFVTDFTSERLFPPTLEGWYDPEIPETLPGNHQEYFQYNVCLDSVDWFFQEQGTIYWLVISAVLVDPVNTQWGWKSSQDHFNDDAVWAVAGGPWSELFEPGASSNPITNQFFVEVDETGNLVSGFGEDAYGNGWYQYPSEWWNIWFYDHPFSAARYKEITIVVDAFPFNTAAPAFLELAVNWSTDAWSLDQPPGDSSPPLPGTDEALYIGRATLINSDNFAGHHEFTWVIPDYNPEWVSIDVRGFNFIIEPGIITHECKAQDPVSMDLSFVITGEPPVVDSGACCYSDPIGIDNLCTVTTQAECETVLGGQYMGDGTACSGLEACCLPDGTCLDADALCCQVVLGGVPQGPGTVCSQPEACCLPDGTCQMLDPLCCDDLGGTPQGAGTQCTTFEACCLPNGTCKMLDPLCCDDLGGIPGGPGSVCQADSQACCYPDGTCDDLDPLCCDLMGGTPQGPGTFCLGDNNGNMIDDACEEPTGGCCFDDGSCLVLTEADCDAAAGDYLGDGVLCQGDNNNNGQDDACETWIPGDDHKMHFPQLPDAAGWDVNATDPMVLADDWRCSQTGWIKDFHFWGSWRHQDTGIITAFVLSVHEDIPADPPQIPYSRPGALLWEKTIDVFNLRKIDPTTQEGWFNPANGVILPFDHQQFWQYDVYLDSIDWFWQEEGTIYWLNISAIVADPVNTQWGWKSTQDHFNDDAVWAFVPDYNWIDLYEPQLPPLPKTDTFFVEVDPTGQVIGGGGSDPFGQGWYFYPQFEWWNIWFYDHPFTYNRFKTIVVDLPFGIQALDPTAFVEIAVNWSTDQWSLDQPVGDSSPPLPGVDENLYIGRATLYQGDPNPQPQTYTFVIPDYNPEWVSIDIRGNSFFIENGVITHVCEADPTDSVSLDLAFVVTGEGPCDAVIGDADGSGFVDIDDAVYLINHIFLAGPFPVPYAVASGDANCDCLVDIDDVTYIIAFIFSGGPPPCDCDTWVSLCGPLH